METKLFEFLTVSLVDMQIFRSWLFCPEILLKYEKAIITEQLSMFTINSLLIIKLYNKKGGKVGIKGMKGWMEEKMR